MECLFRFVWYILLHCAVYVWGLLCHWPLSTSSWPLLCPCVYSYCEQHKLSKLKQGVVVLLCVFMYIYIVYSGNVSIVGSTNCPDERNGRYACTWGGVLYTSICSWKHRQVVSWYFIMGCPLWGILCCCFNSSLKPPPHPPQVAKSAERVQQAGWQPLWEQGSLG